MRTTDIYNEILDEKSNYTELNVSQYNNNEKQYKNKIKNGKQIFQKFDIEFRKKVIVPITAGLLLRR